MAALAVVALAGCDRRSQGPAPTAPTAPAPTAAAPAPAPPPANWPFTGKDRPAAADPAEYLKRNYYFVLDGSGSMSERKCSGDRSKMTVAKEALTQFIAQIPASANVGGLAFDDNGTREIAPLQPKDEARLRNAIGGVHAGGGTPLANAIQMGYDALTQRAAAQLGYGEYHLVVVTDGEANQGQDPRAAVDRMTQHSPVVLHTIGFCIGANHSLNQPGKVIYRAADNPQELASSLAEVLAEAPSFDAKSFK
jgi:uncharacterized protein with von Willebrand factor type A (vWA) domain